MTDEQIENLRNIMTELESAEHGLTHARDIARNIVVNKKETFLISIEDTTGLNVEHEASYSYSDALCMYDALATKKSNEVKKIKDKLRSIEL